MTNMFKCPKCGSTAFRLISHVTIYDKLYFDETGKPTMKLEELDQISERSDPFYCEEVECAECDEPISKQEPFKDINRNEVEYEW